MKPRNIYFTLVPAWLATALERRGLPLDVACDLSKLQNTLSLDDVCFYIAYVQNAEHYVSNLFNDMQNVLTSETNAKWLIDNHSHLAGVKSQLTRFFAEQTALQGNHIPASVRKTNYVAQALPGQECLAIVGRETSDPLNSAQLADQSVGELAKLMTFEEYKHFNVFKAFTQTAA